MVVFPPLGSSLKDIKLSVGWCGPQLRDCVPGKLKIPIPPQPESVAPLFTTAHCYFVRFCRAEAGSVGTRPVLTKLAGKVRRGRGVLQAECAFNFSEGVGGWLYLVLGPPWLANLFPCYPPTSACWVWRKVVGKTRRKRRRGTRRNARINP